MTALGVPPPLGVPALGVPALGVPALGVEKPVALRALLLPSFAPPVAILAVFDDGDRGGGFDDDASATEASCDGSSRCISKEKVKDMSSVLKALMRALPQSAT